MGFGRLTPSPGQDSRERRRMRGLRSWTRAELRPARLREHRQRPRSREPAERAGVSTHHDIAFIPFLSYPIPPFTHPAAPCSCFREGWAVSDRAVVRILWTLSVSGV